MLHCCCICNAVCICILDFISRRIFACVSECELWTPCANNVHICMCTCVCVLMALDAALIIFAPLDNLVHKLIKMYLNVSKYSWMRCVKQPGDWRHRLQASSAIWRRIWIICRAATSDKLQATVPTNPSHFPTPSLPHHFHLGA